MSAPFSRRARLNAILLEATLTPSASTSPAATVWLNSMYLDPTRLDSACTTLAPILTPSDGEPVTRNLV